MSGDIFHFLIWRWGAPGVQWEGPRDATPHLTMHRTAPQLGRNGPTPNVNSAKLWLQGSPKGWEAWLSSFYARALEGNML